MDGILGFVSYFFSVYGVSPYLVFLMVSSLKSVIVRSRYIGGRDLSSRRCSLVAKIQSMLSGGGDRCWSGVWTRNFHLFGSDIQGGFCNVDIES